ncbi:MAG: histidine phosphatase family protein [Chloroflexi bacterium]|nr:histidine phosphatase family protein [Chloroflexota bacterium]MYD48440.1 histidine phosphatase family protein [Chloroflexota bacterium]
MRLHLLRHGETDINAAGRLQGTTNSVLTPLGRRQAREMGIASLAWNPVAIYSSPLSRARDVAAQIGDLTGLPVTVEPRITEMNMGALEGVTIQEMREGWPDLYQGWRRDASSVTMPDGESLGDVQQRAMSAFDEMDTCHGLEDAVIAVTHNFTIRCIVAAVIGLPLANINHMDLSLGSCTTIRTGSRGRRMSSYNAVDHLTPENRVGY